MAMNQRAMAMIGKLDFHKLQQFVKRSRVGNETDTQKVVHAFVE